MHHPLRTIFTHNTVGHRRRRGNQVQVELALQAVTGNFHVQKAQEATAETKAQRDGGFWFVGQRGIVKLKLLQRITQSREICLRNWEQTRVHHWLRIGVTGQRLIRALGSPGDGVTHLGLTHVFHAGNEIADLTRAQALNRCWRRGNHTEL